MGDGPSGIFCASCGVGKKEGAGIAEMSLFTARLDPLHSPSWRLRGEAHTQ